MYKTLFSGANTKSTKTKENLSSQQNNNDNGKKFYNGFDTAV